MAKEPFLFSKLLTKLFSTEDGPHTVRKLYKINNQNSINDVKTTRDKINGKQTSNLLLITSNKRVYSFSGFIYYKNISAFRSGARIGCSLSLFCLISETQTEHHYCLFNAHEEAPNDEAGARRLARLAEG